MELSLAAARSRLAMLCVAGADPVLTSDELDLLLADAATVDADALPPASYRTWRPEHAFAAGEVTVAEVDGERLVFEVTTAGTSGDEVPAWSADDAVVDGSVTWTYAGLAWHSTYDLAVAAAAGWRLKAGKLASRVDFSADGASFQLSQQRAACLEMANTYASRAAGGSGGMRELVLRSRWITEADDQYGRERELYARAMGLLPEQLP